jgi:hypothetical protein
MSYAGNTERLAISFVTCRWPFKDRPLLSDLSASCQIDKPPKDLQSRSL